MAVVACCAVAGTADLPAAAGAKSAPSGLACLKGKWASQGFRSEPPGISGAAATVLKINLTTSKGHQYGDADANYNHSTPLRFSSDATGYLVLRGSSFGRFEYLGHGKYHFDPTISSEEVTLVADGMDLFTKDVKGNGSGYADISCSSTKMTTTVNVPTPQGGTAKAIEVWKHTH